MMVVVRTDVARRLVSALAAGEACRVRVLHADLSGLLRHRHGRPGSLEDMLGLRPPRARSAPPGHSASDNARLQFVPGRVEALGRAPLMGLGIDTARTADHRGGPDCSQNVSNSMGVPGRTGRGGARAPRLGALAEVGANSRRAASAWWASAARAVVSRGAARWTMAPTCPGSRARASTNTAGPGAPAPAPPPCRGPCLLNWS